MKTQIVDCPECQTTLFGDTTVCHSCGHVLTDLSGDLDTLPTDQAVVEDTQICQSCGESCRNGLVRCWNCSTFLRPEIEASYRSMRKTGNYEIERVELPVIEASSVTEGDSLVRRPAHRPNARTSKIEVFLGSDAQSEGSEFVGDDDELSFDSAEFSQFAPQQESEEDFTTSETFRLQPQEDVPEPKKVIEPPVRQTVIEPPVRRAAIEPPVRVEAKEPPAPVVAKKPEPQPPVETEGDILLKIAADEEQDIQRVRKTLRSKDSFVIFCPQGCRIRVKEKHRGKAGKCPRCQSPFVVPKKVAPKIAPGSASAEPVLVSRYKIWIPDVRLHVVDPTKLRLKADSLLNDCLAVDLGFSDDDLLVATLLAGKFGANAKKIPPLREAMVEHFKKQGTVDALTVAAKVVFPKDFLSQLVIAQPAPFGTESIFSNIPVFGENRIAVRIPKMPEDLHYKYFSFFLSEFRAFAEALKTLFGMEGFGTNTEIPLTENYAGNYCGFTNTPILELGSLNYYEKDPGFKLEISGWRCAGCGITISEAARAESKLGGANGKSIAKAKCPKCTQKFGNLPLYQLEGAGKPAPVAEESDIPAE